MNEQIITDMLRDMDMCTWTIALFLGLVPLNVCSILLSRVGSILEMLDLFVNSSYNSEYLFLSDSIG